MTNTGPAPSAIDDLSVTPGAATLYTLVLAVPLTIVLLALYSVLSPNHSSAIHSPTLAGTLLFIVAVIVGTFAHEAIHAMAWVILGHVPRQGIRFGFQAKTMAPYAHAINPMPARTYRLGTALPALLLGIVPFLIGTPFGNLPVALFGILFTIAAGGDILVLWVIRKVDANAMVQDHPSRVGCIVVRGGR